MDDGVCVNRIFFCPLFGHLILLLWGLISPMPTIAWAQSSGPVRPEPDASTTRRGSIADRRGEWPGNCRGKPAGVIWLSRVKGHTVTGPAGGRGHGRRNASPEWSNLSSGFPFTIISNLLNSMTESVEVVSFYG